jgi:hypothetical protein
LPALGESGLNCPIYSCPPFLTGFKYYHTSTKIKRVIDSLATDTYIGNYAVGYAVLGKKIYFVTGNNNLSTVV